MTVTHAREKALELFKTGDRYALVKYLERWRTDERPVSALHVIDVIHAYEKIASQDHIPQPDKLIGHLTVQTGQGRVLWRSLDADVTVSEFKVVKLLADNVGEFVTYRAIYDAVRYAGFTAGCGEDGYKANVRSFIKRLRRRFHTLDPTWNEIENYTSYGYRWRKPAMVEAVPQPELPCLESPCAGVVNRVMEEV